MELYLNLIRKPEPRTFQFWLGIFFFMIALGWIFIKPMEHEKITFFDGLYFVAMFANGIFHTLEGRGRSVNSLFGKAYVYIDEEHIKIKPSIFSSGQEFFWNDIQSIRCGSYYTEIMNKKEKFQRLKSDQLEYPVLKQVKDTLKKIGTAKNIEIR